MPRTATLFVLLGAASSVVCVTAFSTALPFLSQHNRQVVGCQAAPRFSADDAFEAGLRRRLQDVVSANDEEAEREATGLANVPAISFDALLPCQRLEGSTTDPTFTRFLCELGLGGVFMMTSLNYKKRQLRRSGVLARIEFVDVERAGSGGPLDPTEVSFAVVGGKRCRFVGPAQDFVTRVGRWRRVYDADGEEALLGWGSEKIVDDRSNSSAASSSNAQDLSSLKHTEWSSCEVDCALDDEDEEPADAELVSRAEMLLPLLDRWLELASDPRTYDNTDVVASVRQQRGKAQLSVDPHKLMKRVLDDLGDRPPATQPTALAMWGAALINPLPPLGVSVEIRGAMLEAASADERLRLLERGLVRSIWNLDGSAPLSPY